MSDTIRAEMMAGTAKNWQAHSVMNAFIQAGVECPISGDALRLEQVPYRTAFYYRKRDIDQRERAAEQGTLW